MFPKNEDIKIIDVFAAEGSIYNKESISERLYFLKKLGLQNEIDQKKTYQTVQTKRLPFDVLYPNLCPETSIKNLRRYELLTPLPTFKDLKGQQIKTY